MKTLNLVICAVVFLAIAVPCHALENDHAKPAAMSTTRADQTGVALTVYNDNLGLVKDRRSINLAKGLGELRFMDVVF